MVRLTDYSAAVYPAGTPPPGVQPRIEASNKRRWVGHRWLWPPAVTAELVRALEARRGTVIATYEGEPVDVSWPAQETDGQLGFRVPEPDSQYLISCGEGKGRPRTLDLALPGRMPAGEPAADDLDRLELVRLVAIIVDGLHRSDVVTAGLSWSTFLYAFAPRPALMLRRPEGIRRLGGEFLDPSRIMQRSEDWSTSPFDADRYQLALLAYRLLVSHEPDGEIEPWSSRGVPGLTEVQNGWLWRLWERSRGPVGTRPQAAEWMEALGA